MTFHLDDKVIIYRDDGKGYNPYMADSVFAIDDTGIILKTADYKWNLDGTLSGDTYPKYHFEKAASEAAYRTLLIWNIIGTVWHNKPTDVLEDVYFNVMGGSLK